MTWPVRSGLLPPLAEGFIARPDTAPDLETALVPGTTVALVSGQETAKGTRDWPESCGKTQLAAYVAESLWRSRTVDLLAWVAASSRASILSGDPGVVDERVDAALVRFDVGDCAQD